MCAVYVPCMVALFPGFPQLFSRTLCDRKGRRLGMRLVLLVQWTASNLQDGGEVNVITDFKPRDGGTRLF